MTRTVRAQRKSLIPRYSIKVGKQKYRNISVSLTSRACRKKQKGQIKIQTIFL